MSLVRHTWTSRLAFLAVLVVQKYTGCSISGVRCLFTFSQEKSHTTRGAWSTVEDNGLAGWVEWIYEWESREEGRRKCMYVCVYVHICVCMYTHLCICAYICACALVCMCRCVCAYVCMCLYVCECTQMYMCISSCWGQRSTLGVALQEPF